MSGRDLDRKRFENFHLPSHDGSHEIFLTRFRNFSADESPEHSLILFHDLTDSHQRLIPFCQQLIRGMGKLNLILLDLRGHGLSTGTRAHIDNFEDYALDFVHIYHLLKERGVLLPEERPVCVGQGMSALMLLQLYQTYGFPVVRHLKGLALFNPILRFRSDFVASLPTWSSGVIKKGGESVKRLHLPLRFNGSELTSSTERAIDYDSHPLVSHTITLSLLGELIEACGKLRSSCYFIDIPCYFVTSNRDPYVDEKVSRIYMKGIPKGLVTHQPYANLLHDIYNESLPDDFWPALQNWIRGLK